MAHFAKIENNLVTQILVVNNAVLMDGDSESEQKGKEFLVSLYGGYESEWVQTSYNSNFRSKYAGLGYSYDSENDIFIRPQPFDSWVLDSDFDWQPPTDYPTDEQLYTWNEDNQSWDLLQ